MKYPKSMKARAWLLSADWLELRAADMSLYMEPEIRKHIMLSIVPSLKRRAAIIERNKR